MQRINDSAEISTLYVLDSVTRPCPNTIRTSFTIWIKTRYEIISFVYDLFHKITALTLNQGFD